MWRVLIADDDPVVVSVLEAILGTEPDFSVVATASSADGAALAAREHAPDLVILDVAMPGGGGPAAARAILAGRPQTMLVALSGSDDVETVHSMLAAGVHRFAVKGAPLEELVALIRSVMRSTVSLPEPEPEPAARPEPRVPGVARVLLALEDSRSLLGLAQAFTREPGIEVVGLAQSGAHARSLAARHLPDVALVDARIGAADGAAVSAVVRGASPNTAVLALWERADRDSLLSIVGSGAHGHLHSADPAEVARAIRELAAGGSALSPALAALLIEELAARMAGSEPAPRSTFLESLDQAARGEGMVTMLQPIVDLRDHHVVGHEALTRFTLEPRQAPDVWFAEATAVGRGRDLELAAARAALDQLDRLPEGSWLSINVSPQTAGDPELLDLIAAGGGERIVLEMTEHAPIDDYAALVAAMAPLRESGVRFAVDDAGAGFASLRHILLLDPDFIKLDTSLCRGVGEDGARRAMARALVGFAAETGSTVIAEGLESVQDVDALRTLDVPLGQGFRFGRPAVAAAPA